MDKDCRFRLLRLFFRGTLAPMKVELTVTRCRIVTSVTTTVTVTIALLLKNPIISTRLAPLKVLQMLAFFAFDAKYTRVRLKENWTFSIE